MALYILRHGEATEGYLRRQSKPDGQVTVETNVILDLLICLVKFGYWVYWMSCSCANTWDHFFFVFITLRCIWLINHALQDSPWYKVSHMGGQANSWCGSTGLTVHLRNTAHLWQFKLKHTGIILTTASTVEQGLILSDSPVWMCFHSSCSVLHGPQTCEVIQHLIGFSFLSSKTCFWCLICLLNLISQVAIRILKQTNIDAWVH